MAFDKKFEQVLLGSMCGDGRLRISDRAINPYYSETHCMKQYPYLIYKYKIFKKYISSRVSFVNSKKRDTITILSTLSSKYYLKYHKLFYLNGKGYKRINFKILDMLKWQAIAIWYIDDGFYCYQTKTLSISTNKTHLGLVNNFFLNKGFNSKIRKCNQIRFNRNSTLKFISRIKPYVLQMPKCVHYKLGENKLLIRKAKQIRLNHYKNNFKHYSKLHKLWLKKNKDKVKLYEIKRRNNPFRLEYKINYSKYYHFKNEDNH